MDYLMHSVSYVSIRLLWPLLAQSDLFAIALAYTNWSSIIFELLSVAI